MTPTEPKTLEEFVESKIGSSQWINNGFFFLELLAFIREEVVPEKTVTETFHEGIEWCSVHPNYKRDVDVERAQLNEINAAFDHLAGRGKG